MTVHDERAGQEYRFVGEGPVIQPSEVEACLAILDAEDAGWLVISGSLPRGIAPETLAQIVRRAHAAGRRVVVDSSGPALRATLGQGLALIKPSLREFEELVGTKLPTPVALVLALARDAAPADALAWGLAAGAAAVMATGTARPRRATIAALHAGALNLP